MIALASLSYLIFPSFPSFYRPFFRISLVLVVCDLYFSFSDELFYLDFFILIGIASISVITHPSINPCNNVLIFFFYLQVSQSVPFLSSYQFIYLTCQKKDDDIFVIPFFLIHSISLSTNTITYQLLTRSQYIFASYYLHHFTFSFPDHIQVSPCLPLIQQILPLSKAKKTKHIYQLASQCSKC